MSRPVRGINALIDFYNAGDSLSLDLYLLKLAFQRGGESLSQEELESVFPICVDLENKEASPRLLSFFTLMSTVISGYLSNPLKKAAFVAKIGFINARHLNN